MQCVCFKNMAALKGRPEGMEQGLKQGVEQGSKEQQIKISQALKSKGLDIDMISECTGLSFEEIEKL